MGDDHVIPMTMFNKSIKYYRIETNEFGSFDLITKKTCWLEDYLNETRKPNTYRYREEALAQIIVRGTDYVF